ncbi:MAG: hypothetical protein IH840_11860, partial [Candidatus Heimdallarchaeota archaeon]|nr:hypothetical protein [Candidatus Heimdallarchaeota archaeon]
VRTYINQGLKLSGFKQAVKSIGKTWLLDESGIKMSLLGVKNPKVEIRLPRLGDPDEFGFQEVGTMVKTTCTLDMLPLKLQAIRLYLSQFKNS